MLKLHCLQIHVIHRRDTYNSMRNMTTFVAEEDGNEFLPAVGLVSILVPCVNDPTKPLLTQYPHPPLIYV